MSARCDICSKELQTGNQVSHSNIKTKRVWKPNIKRTKALINGTPKTIKVCTRCLRSGKVQRAI
ncbi:MAG TPA: 50S ribosomal protein L28 [Firmicutes bacterium]|nr:50S ribosomal protein L28 [Bacillota bacterium]